MISVESQEPPTSFKFDVAVVAVGYEQRCRWVVAQHDIEATTKLGLEFGFLTEASYEENTTFFASRGFKRVNGVDDQASARIEEALHQSIGERDEGSVFVDISSMSREMIANVVLGLAAGAKGKCIRVCVAYSPSSFEGKLRPAPIRLASPIKPELAGWSTRPERPLGAIFGLGCEPHLALGALQVLEPDKAWLFTPHGIDPKYDADMQTANKHIGDIFNITTFEYDITNPVITRGRLEALLNAVDRDYRAIVVPFGPKIFAWLAIATVVFTRRLSVGVWTFSSREQGSAVDRKAEGTIIWHSGLFQRPI